MGAASVPSVSGVTAAPDPRCALLEPPAPSSPSPGPPGRARSGLLGYGCLLLGLTGGLGGGGLLAFLAVSRIVRGAQAELTQGAEAVALSLSLEGAVIAAGAGAVLFLIGVVCGVVMLKELADDATRQHRGPV